MLTLEYAQHELPPIVHDIVELIGWSDAEALIKKVGGVSLDFTAGKRNSYFLDALNDAVGKENTKLLLKHFGGSREYIPRCAKALQVLRDTRFRNDYMRLTKFEKMSGRMAIVELCPQYGISDRTGWAIIRRNKQQRTISNQADFFDSYFL